MAWWKGWDRSKTTFSPAPNNTQIPILWRNNNIQSTISGGRQFLLNPATVTQWTCPNSTTHGGGVTGPNEFSETVLALSGTSRPLVWMNCTKRTEFSYPYASLWHGVRNNSLFRGNKWNSLEFYKNCPLQLHRSIYVGLNKGSGMVNFPLLSGTGSYCIGSSVPSMGKSDPS